MAEEIQSWLQQARNGDDRALGKLLSRVDAVGLKSLGIPELLEPSSMAYRIGITGPPGAGKSTLIAKLLELFRKDGLRIGVLAVDPSSPFSKGAILGDRIRYTEDAVQGVFVRSLATRGSFGGLSASAYPMLRVFDACGFDLVLIETVGVGQVEVDVMHVADHVVLLLVPESGDSIQAMKAGILEIADTYVVNKADRPGADALKREIENNLLLSSKMTDEKSASAKVLLTSANSGDGIEDLYQLLKSGSKSELQQQRNSVERLRHEAMALLRPRAEEQFRERVLRIYKSADLAALAAE